MISKRDISIVLKCADEMFIQRVRKAVGLRKRPLKSVLLGKVRPLDEMPGCASKVLSQAEQGRSVGPSGPGQAGREADVMLPAVKQYDLTDVNCAGTHAAFFRDGTLWVPRIDGVSATRCDCRGTMLLRQGDRFNMLHNRVDAELSRGIYLGGCGASNYYHWMTEILPKFHYLDDLDEAYDDYPLLISSYALKYESFQDALSCFSGKREVVYLDEELIYHIDNLVYLTCPSIHPYSLLPGEQLTVEDHFFRHSVLKSVRDSLVSGLEAVPKSGNDRLFFARSGHRRNYNEEAVFELFRRRGFRKVFMAELTLKEQISTIQGAEMLVGPTGAEWTNLMFCSPGTKAICWMNEAWGEFSCFSNLADIFEVDLQYVLYSSKARTMVEMNCETYELSIEALLEALELSGICAGEV